MAIKMSPDELRSYAQKLLNNCTEAQALAKRIDSNIKAVASNWEGQAQQRYVSDFEKVKPTLEKTIPEQLTTMAQNLKSMADKFQEVDEAFGS